MNILTAAGIAQINEPISPKNGERIWGGLGVVTFNQVSQYNEEENPNDPIMPPDCPNCGGGIEPEPSVPPSANCEKKNISELKQVLDDYANQSFCDKEFPDVQFSTFIGYDKPPSDSTAQEIELRMLCPVDFNCESDDPKDKVGDNTCIFIVTDRLKDKDCSDQCPCTKRMYEHRKLSYNDAIALFNQLKSEYLSLYDTYISNSCSYQNCLDAEDIIYEHDSFRVIDDEGNCEGQKIYRKYKERTTGYNDICLDIYINIRAEGGHNC